MNANITQKNSVKINYYFDENLQLSTGIQGVEVKWNDFNYTGDNALASTWIFNNIIRHIKATNVSWGSNQTNTTYTFKASGNTWTKDKSN